MVKQTRWLGSVLCASMLAVASSALAEPVSTLYLTAGDQNQLFRASGQSLTTVVGAGSFEYAIAVRSDVRTLSAYPAREQGSGQGVRYDLNLSRQGDTYLNTFGSQLLDGTTDGRFNYTVQWNSGLVVQFDRNWANGQVVASGLQPDTIGITFDPFTNTFWTASREGNTLTHFSNTWIPLESFEVTGGPTGLAFDPADRTLWLLQQGMNNRLAQYSTRGDLLSTITYTPVSQANTLGAEFSTAPVPEPASLLLLGGAVLGYFRPRRRGAQCGG